MLKTRKIKAYLAAPIFTERDRNFNAELKRRILALCPNMDLYLAQENASINDKKGCATSIDIYMGDVIRLKESDMVIAVTSGDMPPIGTSYEIAYFCSLCEADVRKKLVVLYDDSREGSRTYSDAKRDAMLSGIAENQWPYINLLAVGFIKMNGILLPTSDELVSEVVKAYNTLDLFYNGGMENNNDVRIAIRNNKTGDTFYKPITSPQEILLSKRNFTKYIYAYDEKLKEQIEKYGPEVFSLQLEADFSSAS